MVDMPSIGEIRQQKQQVYEQEMQQQLGEMRRRPTMKDIPTEYVPEIQAAAIRQGQQVAVGENPFDVQRYQNVPMPDVPISYGGGITESLLNDNEVPEEIKKKFWFVFHRDNVLTFLDKDRKNNKLLNFDITKIDILNSVPFYDYSFEKELEFNILRNVLETKLDRAMGFRGSNVKNERIMLQSQFSEQRQISEHGGGGNIKEGFFKRLLGRR